MGPAKKRSVVIKTLVQMKAKSAVLLLASTVFVMLTIQLSVPSSTVPTIACNRNRNSRMGAKMVAIIVPIFTPDWLASERGKRRPTIIPP